MKKAKWFYLLIIILMIGGLAIYVVSVKSDKNSPTMYFPDFTITINGHISTAANNYGTAMFPLFLYHDTLYYPLTAASKNLLNLRDGEPTKEKVIVLFQADGPV